MNTIPLPRQSSKAFKVLLFIGSHNGVRYMDIERFICEMNGLNYDLMVPATTYDYRADRSKKCFVRRHKGIWGTNLCSGSGAILHKYCEKGLDKRWRLSLETAGSISAYKPARKIYSSVDAANSPITSSLASQEFPSDEIKGNSKVVEQRIIVMEAPQVKPKPTIPAKSPELEAVEALMLAKKRLAEAEEAHSKAEAQLEEAELLLDRAAENVRDVLGL